MRKKYGYYTMDEFAQERFDSKLEEQRRKETEPIERVEEPDGRRRFM